MGLDNFAVMNTKERDPIPSEHFKLINDRKALCSGICSCDENAIRGKVYNDLVEFASGLSLYADELREAEIDKIVEGLGKVDFPTFIRDTGNPYGNEPEDVAELLKWFKVVQDRDGIVVSWY
jgi:hypothetical protein